MDTCDQVGIQNSTQMKVSRTVPVTVDIIQISIHASNIQTVPTTVDI